MSRQGTLYFQDRIKESPPECLVLYKESQAGNLQAQDDLSKNFHSEMKKQR